VKLDTTSVVKILTMLSLVGLLFDVGLRLTWREVSHAVRISRLAWILAANFVAVPILAVAAARSFGLPVDVSTGMILLAAAPFAPVVPVFAKMARGDLALAAGLTALFPFAASFLSPFICQFSLSVLPHQGSLQFNIPTILLVLVSTITVPLAAGLVVRRTNSSLAHRLSKPAEILSQATGALSLAYVSVVEFGTITSVGLPSLLVMIAIFEVSLLLGYAVGGPSPPRRRVVALGTSNRNIALAILIAVASFPGSPVVGTVVANGLVLIFLGLLHVGYWRFVHPDAAPAA
jgi:BASS family bile acid:Na+ symporter